jgi:hypothetical protein
MYKYFEVNIPCMNERLNSTENQAGPCGILCGSCPLGGSIVAESASRTRKHITECDIPNWAPFVPGGEAIDWTAVDLGLAWMETYARCAGCENGGGPPDCTIRACAREKGYDLCSSCEELEGCTRFEWLRDQGQMIKDRLNENRGLSKEDYIKKMTAKMP